MAIDRFGHKLTTTSDDAARHYLRALDCMVTANFGAEEALDAALKADPDFALAHIAKARWLMMHMRGGEGRAEIAAARAQGARIAFDTNFRPALWQGREAQAAQILRDLSFEADLVFAGRRATAMMVGGDYTKGDPDAGFAAAAEAMFAAAPGLQHMAATRRMVHSSDRQDITALLADRNGSSASETLALDRIVDRVGTGDAFAAGVMHGLLAGHSRDETVRFAAACSNWAHSVPGDFMRASLADIESLVSGSGDVRR